MSDEPTETCGHCGRPQRGYAMAYNTPLCHPDTGLDCYRLITVYRHTLACTTCMDVRVLEDAARNEYPVNKRSA